MCPPARFPFTRSLRRHWPIAALLFLCLALSSHYYVKVQHGNQESRSAILRWQNQVLAFMDGGNIWERFNYPNPPIMALLLGPLMYLPPLTCSLVWFFLKTLMVAVSVHWVFRMVESPEASVASGQWPVAGVQPAATDHWPLATGHWPPATDHSPLAAGHWPPDPLPLLPFPPAGQVLVLALVLRPILGDLTHGNVNIFILFLVVAGLGAFYRRRDLTAGLLLGLAIACKLTPALFLPYLVWKRAWRTLAGCTLGLVLFFGVVPALFLGIRTGSAGEGVQRNAVFLRTWVQQMVRPYVVDGAVMAEHTNQSLAGLVHRLGRHTPSFTTYTSQGYVPTDYHNLADLDRHIISWVLRGCMALFALLVMWSCRTPLGQRSGWPLLAEFSVVVLGMLLFSERTWKHHCVTLLLPVTVLGYGLFHRPRKRYRERYLACTLIGVAVLMMATVTLPGFERWGKLAEVYGAYVWAYLLLLAALVALLRQSRPFARVVPPGSARIAVLAFRLISIRYPWESKRAGAGAENASPPEISDDEIGRDRERQRQQFSA